jgi:alkaline phosphatase
LGCSTNDIAGLIHDQIAFDEAVKVAMDFAEKTKKLLVITTDHGNANNLRKEANANLTVFISTRKQMNGF